MKIESYLSVLGQLESKAQIFIFRVAIFMQFQQISNRMVTLIKKIIPDLWYLWLKTLKTEIEFSGFPKKACQGCHISEGHNRNFMICTSFRRILHACKNAINDLLGNWLSPKKGLWPGVCFSMDLSACRSSWPLHR